MKTFMPKGTDPASVIDYLIIGGGLAGVTTADTLRREGAAGSVAILSAEAMAPYHRPRLSKSYLVGASSANEMLVHPVEYYAAQKIDLRLGVRVARVDTKQRQVHTTAGEVVRYGQMLLAPGAAPRRSSAAGHTLPGAYYLHERADADAIRAAAQSGRRAVIVGASYLGMEVAFSLQELGLSVTLIEVGPRTSSSMMATLLLLFVAHQTGLYGTLLRTSPLPQIRSGVFLSVFRLGNIDLCQIVELPQRASPSAFSEETRKAKRETSPPAPRHCGGLGTSGRTPAPEQPTPAALALPTTTLQRSAGQHMGGATA